MDMPVLKLLFFLLQSCNRIDVCEMKLINLSQLALLLSFRAGKSRDYYILFGLDVNNNIENAVETAGASIDRDHNTQKFSSCDD
ncbi:predicted protein [Coccidioides posadasii str. Silveira]|uniref:Predicted protein n=1 Tax=Coccidioides posadasii (strain RMSCC 757 / Silveira) TaxID=443226 RepID=E9DIR2_COCPS|nr:predicted protein [Coccidioides posadasii str. Silveira]